MTASAKFHRGIIGEGGDDHAAVRIHDNDFVNDQHTIHYLGRFNRDEVCKAFAEIGYEGDFTSEASAYESYFPAELLPAALRLEASVFRHLIAKIERCR